MNLYNSSKYISDLDYVINETIWLEELRNSSILITGATGLICSAISDLLLRYNEKENANITVYAAGRSKDKVFQRFSKYKDYNKFLFVPYDACKSNKFNFCVDYIIHGGNNAYPGLYMKYPVETMLSNFGALYELLSYAKDKDAKKVVFISSSEIYGKKEISKGYVEEDYGYIDILDSRSCYSNSKRAAETLCSCYYQEYGVQTISVRPGHIYGPTAAKTDSRVSSLFAFNAAEGKDIILKSNGAQIRSYCYMLDAATSILLAAIKGRPGEAYNISNQNSIISIKEMAELIAKFADVKVMFSLPDTNEKNQFNPMDNSSLDSRKLQNLGWKGLFDAPTGFDHTIKIIREAY